MISNSRYVIGFDSVDDESKPENPLFDLSQFELSNEAVDMDSVNQSLASLGIDPEVFESLVQQNVQHLQQNHRCYSEGD